MFFIKDQFTKIWKLEREEKRIKLNISTSEKDRDNKWHNSYWNAVAVGTAKTQIENGDIKESDFCKIASGKVTNESYTAKDGNKRSYLQVTIFAFDTGNSNNDSSNASSSTQNKKGTSKKSAHTSEAASITDEDELPF